MPAEKYGEIYEKLKEMIENGKYQFRDLIPSEARLTQMFDCSRNTVRRALARLSEEGYVQSIHGKGVQVIFLPKKLIEFPLYDANQIRKLRTLEPEEYRWKLLTFTEITAEQDDRVQAFEPGTPLYYTERLYYYRDSPVNLEYSFLKKDNAPGLTAEKAAGSMVDFFESSPSQKMVTTVQRFNIELADETDKKYLDLKEYNCIVRGDSFFLNTNGEIFIYILSHYNPAYYSRYEHVRWT